MERNFSDRLLQSQLKKVPDGDIYSKEGIDAFLKMVNEAYTGFEEERRLNKHIESLSNHELEVANEELRNKNDFLDSFNHGMAHDIKNHTSNIIGLITMLRKYHGRNDAKMIGTIIEKLDLSANQLTAIVQGFLYLSRAEANIDNQFAVINEDEVTTAINAETLFLTMGKDCRINYRFEINELFFSFHVIKIIFVNLISNSIKFSKKNEPIIIDVSLIQTPAGIELLVKDNGLGMNLSDPDNKIFELFNRTGDTRMVKGTGVGLFMIKKIVDRHAGKVAVDSELGKGTIFKIEIPIK
ncbi:MAG: HAMP domain-containing histidine kinase [Bacteroidia bacterium]|nr:HAMP domain-containing histidine kinase [Bacteroidia bacterium]